MPHKPLAIYSARQRATQKFYRPTKAIRPMDALASASAVREIFHAARPGCPHVPTITFVMSEKPREPGEPWSNDEVAELRRMLVAGARVARIAEVLRREEAEIRQKIAELGEEIFRTFDKGSDAD
jgi:hypothetical protein